MELFGPVNRVLAMVLRALMFVYFPSVLYFLLWLPRYTIPFRPLHLAAAAVAWSIPMLKNADWVGEKGISTNNGD